MNSLDLILWVLASPILFVQWLFRLRRTWEFWRMAYTTRIVCGNCGGNIWLIGLWRCGCAYTYRGHVLHRCPVCGSLPRMVRCFACGVTTKLPDP
jgi:hypothetical protein